MHSGTVLCDSLCIMISILDIKVSYAFITLNAKVFVIWSLAVKATHFNNDSNNKNTQKSADLSAKAKPVHIQ